MKNRLEKNKDKEYSYGIKFDDILDFAIGAVVIGIISARIYFVFFNWDYYSQNLSEIFKIWHGGIAIYGAIIGSAIFAFIFCKKRKINFFDFADLIVPYLALAQSIGRWGNFVNQEAFGSETFVPWKMGIYNENLTKYIFVHPTFLYESLCTCAIALFLIYISKKRKFKGQIMYLYFMLYGFARAIIEGLRTDSLMFADFRVSQVLSVFFVIIFGITYFRALNSRAKAND